MAGTGIPVQVIYDPSGDNLDITDFVIFRSARLQSQANAQPGLWSATCRDDNQELDFTTGKRVVWKLDGDVFYGGYLTQVSKAFAFPADDTTHGTSSVKTRQWQLRGADYNILFDKRVLRNTSNYLTRIPKFSRQYDGDLIDTLTSTYLDLPGFLDTTTHVDNVAQIPRKSGAMGGWLTQGSTWRRQMDQFSLISGTTYYIKATSGGAALYWTAIEDNTAPYTLSDIPDLSSSFGFRELDYLIDGTGVVNDALVWGGDQFTYTGTGAATVFSRDKNDSSISDHGRWQWAETHFGDPNYASQEEVDNRSSAIVEGRTGDTIPEQNRGLQRPNKTYTLTWFNRNIPKSGGNYQFIYPGDLTTLELNVFGSPTGGPLIEVLPCRSIDISFPDKDPVGGGAFVRFTGSFSLQRNDPWTVWRAIAKVRKQVIASL